MAPVDGDLLRGKKLTLDLELLEEQTPAFPREGEGAEDRVGFFVTYGAFFFAGAAAIAMWSCITLCLDFFTQRFPDQRVGFVFPVVNMSTLLVISLYMVVAGRQLSLETRMHGSLAAYLVFVVLLPVANILELPGTAAYNLTLLSVVGSTIASSVMQSSAYGLGGVFGPLFIQAIEGGKGFGAIVLFVVRMALKWYYQSAGSEADASVDSKNQKTAMAVFFGMALVIVVLTWALYTALHHTAFAQSLLAEYALVQHDTPFQAPLLSPLVSPPPSPTKRTFLAAQTVSEISPLLDKSATNGTPKYSVVPLNDERGDAVDSESDSESYCSSSVEEIEERASSASVVNVLRAAPKPFFSLFFSYFACLSCFPGIISAIPSTTLTLGDWFPIVLVGCYNLGDLVGKNLPVYVMYFDIATLHWPWLLQAAFLPFFVSALVYPLSDIVVIVAVLMLGIVTGYVATSSIILAPSVCSEFQKEVAGMIGGLASIVGLCAGSYNGLAIETVVQIWLGQATEQGQE